MNQGIFTISLDFELHWGRLDKFPLSGQEAYYLNARKAIPEILRLFEKYGIEATWATVGMLFASDWEEWEHYTPEILPSYKQQKLSAYHWALQNKMANPKCLFAPELISAINEVPGQEIGSHTFAHYYTMEEGQGKDQFRADLKAAKKIAFDKMGISLTSLVFPRNQFDPSSLRVCKQEGFEMVRGNPSDWFWKKPEDNDFWKKVFRTGDTLYPLGHTTSYPVDKILEEECGVLNAPASRLLRPYRVPSLFNKRRINRIVGEMEHAAQKGETYHLWWHPHNFGHHTEKNLQLLEYLLKTYQKLRDRFGMESRAMRSLSGIIEVKAVS